METFVDIMREEKSQLGERISKALEFTSSDEFKKLSHTEKCLLFGQIGSMQSYYNYLQLRINYYE